MEINELLLWLRHKPIIQECQKSINISSKTESKAETMLSFIGSYLSNFVKINFLSILVLFK